MTSPKDTCKEARNAKRKPPFSLYNLSAAALLEEYDVSSFFQRLRQFARTLKREIYALYLAYQHAQTSWYARVWAFVVVAYAISPIDFIPDFVPILGYLDDVILLPLGIWIAIRLIPPSVMEECRALSRDKMGKPTSPAGRWAAVVIVIVWLAILGAAIGLFVRARQGS